MKLWLKITTLLGTGIVSLICSTFGFLMGGKKLGAILNPDDTEYICVCCRPPAMTVPQTWIYSAVFAIAIVAIIWLIIRSLHLSKKHRLIAICVLSVLNLFFIIMLAPFLYTKVSG